MWHGVVTASTADSAAERERMFEQKEKERRDLLSQVTKTAAALSQVMLENKDAETKADNADFDALARACEDIFVHGLKESMMQMMTQTSPYVRTWNIIELFGESHSETGGLVSQVMRSKPSSAPSVPPQSSVSADVSHDITSFAHSNRRSAVQPHTTARVAGNERAMVQRFVRLCIINHQMQALVRFMVQEGVVVREFYEPWAILRSPEEIGICIDLLRTCQTNRYSADATAAVLSDVRFKFNGAIHETTPTATHTPLTQSDVLARFAKFGSRQRRLLFGTSGVCAHVDAGGKLYGAVGYLSLMVENKHKVITWTPVLPFYEALTEVDSDEPKRVTLRTPQQTQTNTKDKEVVPPSTHVNANRRRRVMSTPSVKSIATAQTTAAIATAQTTAATAHTTNANAPATPTHTQAPQQATDATGAPMATRPTEDPAITTESLAANTDTRTHATDDTANTDAAAQSTEDTTAQPNTPQTKETQPTETQLNTPQTNTPQTNTPQTKETQTKETQIKSHGRSERAKSTPRALPNTNTNNNNNNLSQSEGLIPVRAFRIEVRHIEFLKYHRDAHGLYLHKPTAASTAEQKFTHTDTHAHKRTPSNIPAHQRTHAPTNTISHSTPHSTLDTPNAPHTPHTRQSSGPVDRAMSANEGASSPKQVVVQGKARTPVDKALDRGYLRIQPTPTYDASDPLPVLHFHQGNLNDFLGALKLHASKKKSKPRTNPVPKLRNGTADSGSDASDTGSQSSTHTPSHTITPARDDKDVKQEVFAALGWFKNTAESAYKAVTTVNSDQQRKKEVARRNRQRMLARHQSFTQVDRSNEEVYKTRREAAQLLYCDQSRTELPRLSHVTENIYHEGVTLDALGLSTDNAAMAQESLFRELVYFNGIHPTARGAVWRILLGLHPFGSDCGTRRRISREKREEYWALKGRWLINNGEALDDDERDSVMAEREMIEKDVVRTDRTSTFMIGENNPNLAIMVEILVTYTTHCPELGYVQGMSDLLAPVLQICENEADGFWCFVGYMEKMKSLYSIGNDIGIPQSILYLRQLLDVYDPDLHLFLEQQEVVGMFFTYRWFLLNYKREFDADAAIKLWEITWSEHITPYFNIFIALAILISYRDPLLSGHLSGNDVLEFISQLANVMDCDKILALAKAYAGHSLHSSSVPPELKASLYPKHVRPLQAGPDSAQALQS